MECDPCTLGWLNRDSLLANFKFSVGVCHRSWLFNSIRPNRRRIIQQEIARASRRVIRICDLPGRWSLVEVVVLIVGSTRAVEYSTDGVIDARIAGWVAVATAEALPGAAALGRWIIESAWNRARIAAEQRSRRHARLSYVTRFAAITASRSAHPARSEALAADARHRERHGQRRVQSLHQIVPPSTKVAVEAERLPTWNVRCD